MRPASSHVVPPFPSTFPGERVLREERAEVLATFRALDPEDFESSPTLCAGWAPRDVLAHLLGEEDDLGAYVRALGRPTVAHARIVAKARDRGRGEMLARAALWARYPRLLSRVAAVVLIGETAIHHEDVLHPLGRSRAPSDQVKVAMLFTAATLAPGRLLGHRLVPTDLGGPRLGVGREVRGPSVELALWLSGRQGVDDDLEFD